MFSFRNFLLQYLNTDIFTNIDIYSILIQLQVKSPNLKSDCQPHSIVQAFQYSISVQ